MTIIYSQYSQARRYLKTGKNPLTVLSVHLFLINTTEKGISPHWSIQNKAKKPYGLKLFISNQNFSWVLWFPGI